MSRPSVNHAIASGDGHYDSTPHKMASVSLSDDTEHDVAEINRAEYILQLERLRSLESGIGFYADMKDPDVAIKREKDDLIISFKAAGREIVVNLGKAEAFLNLSTDADINPLTRTEKLSKAGEHIHHRVRTKGVDFSSDMSNTVARVIQLRFG
ncbi:MAG: hypothetical protein K2Q32_09005 [Alphaproteobacteria bacterium]|nr:hypothetical protein [Alphaproteobacteria bacterium]